MVSHQCGCLCSEGISAISDHCVPTDGVPSGVLGVRSGMLVIRSVCRLGAVEITAGMQSVWPAHLRHALNHDGTDAHGNSTYGSPIAAQDDVGMAAPFFLRRYSPLSSKSRHASPRLVPMTCAGFPPTMCPGAMGFVTTAPAPTIAPSPIVTPGRMSAP